MLALVEIPLGLLVANAGEWWIHKHILHGLGADRKSFWSFHWHDHHATARKHDMVDEEYRRPALTWPMEPQTKELVALLGLGLGHALIFPLLPWYAATIWASSVRYYFVHRRSHLDPDWARQHLPWHYDHHMGRDQNANWCVTAPFFDHVLGTRKRYTYGGGVPQELSPGARGALARTAAALAGELRRLFGRSEAERIPRHG
jgi:hypothetical protein